LIVPQDLGELSDCLVGLGKLLFVIIFTCHFCACLFYGIGKAEYFYLGIENTWLNIDNNNLL